MKFSELFRVYSFWGLTRIVTDVAATNSLYPKVRFIRRPSYIRGSGKREPGTRGSGLSLRIDSQVDSVRMDIGRDLLVNKSVHIGAIDSTVIGDWALIASGAFVLTHALGIYSRPGHSAQRRL